MKTAKKKGSDESKKEKGKIVLAFQDGPFDVRPEIGKGKIYSCIKLEISNHGYLGDNEGRHKEVEICLSYFQAKVLHEILEDFVISRDCHTKAQLPVHVSSLGDIEWSKAHRWL